MQKLQFFFSFFVDLHIRIIGGNGVRKSARFFLWEELVLLEKPCTKKKLIYDPIGSIYFFFLAHSFLVPKHFTEIHVCASH